MSGCANNQITTKTAFVYPPQAYLNECHKTAFTGTSYGDAIEHLLIVTAERDICASQIEQINHWINTEKKK